MAKYLYQILLISTLCLFVQNTSAQGSTTGFENGNNQYVMRESNLSDMSKEKKIKPVTFGVEAGASIDMSGNDFSSFDLDLFAGYRSHTIKCFGLGIGLHSSFSNNRYYLPIYALFRCNLLSNKSLLFVDFRAGYSTNQMYKGESKKFGSHILIGYNFYQISPFTDEKGTFQDMNGCHLVSIRLGISF